MKLYKTRYENVFVANSIEMAFDEWVKSVWWDLKYGKSVIQIYIRFHPKNFYIHRLPLTLLKQISKEVGKYEY